MIHWASETNDALGLFERFEDMIRSKDAQRIEDGGDGADNELAHQNENPVKVLTSGIEQRTEEPWDLGDGKLRRTDRVPWWSTQYCATAPTVVFGHYWRIPAPGCGSAKDIFEGSDPHQPLGHGNAMCIDYSVGRRYLLNEHPGWPHRLRLGALRWPERDLVFDDDE